MIPKMIPMTPMMMVQIMYHAGDIRPEFANKYLPINEPTYEKLSP